MLPPGFSSMGLVSRTRGSSLCHGGRMAPQQLTPSLAVVVKVSASSLFVCCLFIGCLTSQQHACVSQERTCSDKSTCCHTEKEVADPTFHLTQSQYTDTGPTSPSTNPITPGTWQGSHWSANFEVTGMTRPRKNPVASGIRTRDLALSRLTPYPLAQRGAPSPFPPPPTLPTLPRETIGFPRVEDAMEVRNQSVTATRMHGCVFAPRRMLPGL